MQDGQRERGREVEQEKEAEDPVCALADLEQLWILCVDGCHVPFIDTKDTPCRPRVR